MPVHLEDGAVPGWAGFVQGGSRPHEALPPELRTRLRDLSHTQGKLAQKREPVLIQRDQVRASAEYIRARRILAGDAEAEFMNVAREFVNNDNAQSNVTALITAYTQVEEARNELGVLEADHLQAERTLTGMEWIFVEQENDFYQFDFQELLEQYTSVQHPLATTFQTQFALPPPPPPPPLPPSGFHPYSCPPYFDPMYMQQPPPPPFPPPAPPTIQPLPTGIVLPETASTESFTQIHKWIAADLDHLTKQFSNLRQEQAQRLDVQGADRVSESGARLDEPTSSTFAAKYFDVLERMATYEVKLQHAREEVAQHELLAAALKRRNSDPTYIIDHPLVTTYPMRRALTESAVGTISECSSGAQSIQDWLLTDLKENAMNRRLYRNSLSSVGIREFQDRSLVDWASQHWEAEDISSEGSDISQHNAAEGSCSQHPKATNDHSPTAAYKQPVDAAHTSNVCAHIKDFEGTQSKIMDDKDAKQQSERENPCSIPLPPSPTLTPSIISSKAELVSPCPKFVDCTRPIEVRVIDECNNVPEDNGSTHSQKLLLPEENHQDTATSTARLSESTNREDSNLQCITTDASKQDQLSKTASEDSTRDPQWVLPTIVITEPEPDLTQDTFTPSEVVSPTKASSKTASEYPTCDHPWFHCIRINAASIPRPLSVRSVGKGRRERVFDFLKRRRRSLSTSAAFTAHNPDYTRELRERDLRLGIVFQGL